MSEGAIKLLQLMYQSDIEKEDAVKILKCFDEDLKCLDSYDRRGTIREKQLKQVFQKNVFKYKFSMEFVNRELGKHGIPTVFTDPENYEQSAKEYDLYYKPHDPKEL